MKTLTENNRDVGSSAYWGERAHWFIAAAQHRDSDCLTRSNFRCFKQALADDPSIYAFTAGAEGAFVVESFNHWAVGWVEYLLINPECQPAVSLADSLRASLEDYPVLSDDDLSALEHGEAHDIWRTCYSPSERVDYIRKHRSQFEFQSFADLLGCARGMYFAGYASELIA